MIDVQLTGKSLLVATVLLLTAFFFFFAPSIVAVVAIFLILSLIAYGIWVVGVRINRWLTGRRPAVVYQRAQNDD